MAILDLKRHFSHFLTSVPDRLHFAAHSHACWPDASRAGQLLAWDDAARLIDGKWEHVLGSVYPAAQAHVARQLNLPEADSVVFAPNTHELVKRILSCFPADKPIRLLASDSEFHSFARQIARMEEEGLVQVVRIPAAPFASFAARFAEAAKAGGFDLVFVSQVFFNSGFVVEDFNSIAEAAGDAMLVVDGYHAFMARPVDWLALAPRAFYIAGGYKYAMAGEGAAFMHCPPGWGARPRDTGWYAAFGALSAAQDSRTAYSETGWRFMGSTFDPSGLYRFNAVQEWLRDADVSVAMIPAHVRALQDRFVAGLPRGPLQAGQLVVQQDQPRANFVTFELEQAARVQQQLAARNVVTDYRGSRLRIGFGLYHTAADVDALLGRLQDL